MTLINERITYDTARKIRRFRNEAQEPARQHQLVSAGAARAGRPDATSHRRRGERRAGYTNQLARSAKLRHLHAAAAGPDGRQASSSGWRNGYHYSDQGTKIHGSQEVQGQRQSIQIINRGLRAPTPHTIFGNTRATPSGDVAHVVEPGFRQGRRRARSAIISVNVAPGQMQAASYKRQAASIKFSSSDQAASGKRQAASSKPQAASSRAPAPS